ncbi:MAG: peptidylprolyl isomerase [Leptolyngbyaceae cyanobacterium]
MRLRKWSLILCVVIALAGLTACTSSETTNLSSEPGEETALENAPADSQVSETGATDNRPSTAQTAGLPVLTGPATVELQVNGGTVVMELDGEKAPVTAGNFVDLVQRGVYDGTSFHRVVKSPEPFVVQGGDPQSKDPAVSPQLLGTGSFNDPETNEPRYIPLEIQPEGADAPVYGQTLDAARVTAAPALNHSRGAVAMARSQLPDSASAQFYIALADLPFLDGSYAVFGYVTQGMELVSDIEQGDVIESATVTSGLDNLQQPE